jgi:hypothetical protein
VLRTRLNFFKGLDKNLTSNNKEVFSFALNKRYLYKIYTSLNKAFLNRPLNTTECFFLQLKKKIILQLLKVNIIDRAALQRSKFEFFKHKNNTNLFLSKSMYTAKKRLLKKKKILNIVNKHARFRDNSATIKPATIKPATIKPTTLKSNFVGKLSRKQRR